MKVSQLSQQKQKLRKGAKERMRKYRANFSSNKAKLIKQKDASRKKKERAENVIKSESQKLLIREGNRERKQKQRVRDRVAKLKQK